MAASPFSDEEISEMEALAFPTGFVTNKKRLPVVRFDEVVESYGPLTKAHVDIAQAHLDNPSVLGVRAPAIQKLRHTHHRLAQLLAGGMDEIVAERLCNYGKGYASILKESPAFQELLAHYAREVDTAFADFNTAAANLSMDMLGRLQEVLNESPERLQPSHLLKAIELLADRTGNGPQTKATNLNINVGIGDRMEGIRERLRRVGSS